ncbi:unnamed protein product, partial [Ectocarpus sp. 13 AM-2016]
SPGTHGAWHKPSELDREDHKAEDLQQLVLEGALLRSYRGNAGRQGHDAHTPGRDLRGEPAAHEVPLPGAQDAADTAGEGDHHRVYKERGLQVCSSAGCILSPTRRHPGGYISVPRASLQRLPEDTTTLDTR